MSDWLTSFVAGWSIRGGLRGVDRVHRPGPGPGVEPGEIGVAVGGASDQLPLQGSFTLCGPVRAVGPGRVLDTPTETFTQ